MANSITKGLPQPHSVWASEMIKDSLIPESDRSPGVASDRNSTQPADITEIPSTASTQSWVQGLRWHHPERVCLCQIHSFSSRLFLPVGEMVAKSLKRDSPQTPSRSVIQDLNLTGLICVLFPFLPQVSRGIKTCSSSGLGKAPLDNGCGESLQAANTGLKGIPGPIVPRKRGNGYWESVCTTLTSLENSFQIYFLATGICPASALGSHAENSIPFLHKFLHMP